MQFSSDAVDELLFGASAVIQSAVTAAVLCHFEDMKEMDHPRRSHISAQPWCRQSVQEVYNTMGPLIFCRAFCMTLDFFGTYMQFCCRIFAQL
jgi:hypothetical protein